MKEFKYTIFILLLVYFSHSQQILEPSKKNQIIMKNSDFLEIPLFFRKTIISIESLSSSTIVISDKLGLDANKNCYSSDAEHCQSKKIKRKKMKNNWE